MHQTSINIHTYRASQRWANHTNYWFHSKCFDSLEKVTIQRFKTMNQWINESMKEGRTEEEMNEISPSQQTALSLESTPSTQECIHKWQCTCTAVCLPARPPRGRSTCIHYRLPVFMWVCPFHTWSVHLSVFSSAQRLSVRQAVRTVCLVGCQCKYVFLYTCVQG